MIRNAVPCHAMEMGLETTEKPAVRTTLLA